MAKFNGDEKLQNTIKICICTIFCMIRKPDEYLLFACMLKTEKVVPPEEIGRLKPLHLQAKSCYLVTLKPIFIHKSVIAYDLHRIGQT